MNFFKKKKNKEQSKGVVGFGEFDESTKIKTVKTEVPVSQFSGLAKGLKEFPRKEKTSGRIPPATLGTCIITQEDVNRWKKEDEEYEKSKKPIQDVYLVIGSLKQTYLKVFRYSDVHSALKNGELVVDFGYEPRLLFNYIYEEEMDGLLGHEEYWSIYCFEENVADAIETIRSKMLETLNDHLQEIQNKIKTIQGF